MENRDHREYDYNDDEPSLTPTGASAADDSISTAHIPPEVLGISPLTSKLSLVSFYLPGRSNPIIVNGSRTITIGRRDPKRRVNPTLDLTEDNGAKLGVSRMHAEISFANNKFYVKDIGSSNGTWINDTKLLPNLPQIIESGDQLRIGQLAIVVHFTSAPPNAQEVIEDIIVSPEEDMNSVAFKVTTRDGSYLIEENGGLVLSRFALLGIYLEHVATIYNVIRRAQQQPNTGLCITGVRSRVLDRTVILDISEGEDVLLFLADKLPAFVRVLEGKSAATKKQTDSLQRYQDRYDQIADYALQELVFRFLHDQRDQFVRELSPRFRAILDTSLQLAVTN